MFEALRRKRLSSRGLASGRTRRKQSESRTREFLLHGLAVKIGVFVLSFAAVVLMLPQQLGAGELDHFRAALIAGVIFLTALIHLYVNHPNSFGENDILVLIFGTITLHLALIKAATMVTGLGDWSATRAFLIMPFALAPMVLSVLLSRNHGLYAAIYGGLWGGLLVPPEHAMEFLVFNIVVGSIGVYVTDQVRRRSRLLRAGLMVGIGTLVLAVLLEKIDPGVSLDLTVFQSIAAQAAAVVAVGLLTAMVVGGVLPVLESLFGITTDISWIELADLNHPLMRQLSINAPGTYHHSLMVGNLAEAAAEEVGANPTMCRVCSYFHDVGKLYKPAYFIENQGGGENPHDSLTPTMSALVIISHVKDGVDLALKHKLNGRVIDIIQQHHGTSLVSFFHHKAVEHREAMKRKVEAGELHPEDLPEVNQETFRYPGPLPSSKESAIISLADTVESASRSLGKPSKHKIEHLVHDLIRERMLDGQLSESDLTLTDLDRIESCFTKTLCSTMHHRVAYPKEVKEQEIETPPSTSTPTAAAPDSRQRSRPTGQRGRRKADTNPPKPAPQDPREPASPARNSPDGPGSNPLSHPG